MARILVPTDLSPNSMTGLRFAIQLAAQRNSELVFIHITELLQDDAILPSGPGSPRDLSRKNLQQELEIFVQEGYRSMRVRPPGYRCELYYQFGVVNSVLDYAGKNACDYICISTRGAGRVRKLFGTNASELIKVSEIPVICVPSDYEVSAVTRILYASDLKNYELELEKVVRFAENINGQIDMLHFFDAPISDSEEYTKEAQWEEKLQYKITFHHRVRAGKKKLADELDQAVAEFFPSILVMFTEQDRTFFESVFSSSKAEEYSFRTKVPLLVFNKSSG